MEVGENPMPQNGVGERSDVFEAHVVTPLREGPGFSSQNEILGSPDARSERDPLVDEVRTISVGARACGSNQVDSITHRRVRDGHLPYEPLKRDEIRAGDRVLEVGFQDSGRRAHHVQFIIFLEMVHDDLEHEAVELRFWQRVCALEFDGILGGEHVERLFEYVRGSLNRDAVLLHRLQERRLCLGGCAIDLIRQHDVRKNRSRSEHHAASTRVRVFLDNVGACDVRRHHVRSELDSRELEIQDLSDGVDQQRLCQPGNTEKQAITTHKERKKHLLDHLFLPDYELPYLGYDLLAPRLHSIGEVDVVGTLESSRVEGVECRGLSFGFTPGFCCDFLLFLECHVVAPSRPPCGHWLCWASFAAPVDYRATGADYRGAQCVIA